jgi:hypothetical protein
MKTRLLFLKANLMCIAIVSLTLFSGCQKATEISGDVPTPDEIMKNAGLIHNEMISYYYMNRKLEDASPEQFVSELLELSGEYLDKNGYDPAETKLRISQVREKLGSSPLKSESAACFSINEASFLSQISEIHLYSDHFIHELGKVLALAEKTNDCEQVKEYVNSTFNSIKFTSGNDLDGQQLFSNIFNSSYEFWGNFEKGNLKAKPISGATWIVINDGIGGILGSVFGPIGSIVAATVFSAGTSEEVNS